jgi:tetratricopeptide (TPR) repeat protein
VGHARSSQTPAPPSVLERSTLWAFRVLTFVLFLLVLPSSLKMAVTTGSSMLQQRGSHGAAAVLLQGWLAVVPKGGEYASSAKLLLAESLKGDGDLNGSIVLLRQLAGEAPAPHATGARVRLALSLLARAEAETAAAAAAAGLTTTTTTTTVATAAKAAAAAAASTAATLADAHSHLAAAIAADPSLLEARVALGRVLQWREKAPEAATELREVLRRDPGHVEARWQLAVALHGAGDCDAAMTHYRHLLDVSKSRHTHLYTRVATCLLQRAHRLGRGGLAATSAGVSASGGGAQSGSNSGSNSGDNGAAAAGDASAGGGGNGGGDDDRRGGGEGANRNNDKDSHNDNANGNAAAVSEAEAMLKLAAAADPGSAEVWTLLGRARLFQGRAAAAAADLRTARRLAPKDPNVAFHLAVVGLYGC